MKALLFEEYMLKKEELKFHHSDAPDANGRFRDLSPKELAKWLIKTRDGDMRRITGSLNQQVAFNKNEDPEYAEKMEKTRDEVKKQLKEGKEKPGPDPYMTGLSDEDEEDKKAQIKKQSKMDDDDPDAYKEMPGDKKAREEGRVKKSTHTKAYHKKFGKK